LHVRVYNYVKIVLC